MTVSELIQLLSAMPQDAQVYCEGCDCINAAASALVEPAGDVVIKVDLSW